MELKEKIRVIEGFPKEGISFKDIRKFKIEKSSQIKKDN